LTILNLIQLGVDGSLFDRLLIEFNANTHVEFRRRTQGKQAQSTIAINQMGWNLSSGGWFRRGLHYCIDHEWQDVVVVLKKVSSQVLKGQALGRRRHVLIVIGDDRGFSRLLVIIRVLKEQRCPHS
jgi:hypothetical protein